jgi:hypothetical protein
MGEGKENYTDYTDYTVELSGTGGVYFNTNIHFIYLSYTVLYNIRYTFLYTFFPCGGIKGDNTVV